MNNKSLWATALCISAVATHVQAAPLDSSCMVLDVIGGNKTNESSPLVSKLAPHWSAKNRDGLTEQLDKLLANLKFAGGSVYRTAILGDDLEEHLIILRLHQGEVAGMLLRYEWSPAGMKLITMEFERKYADYIDTQMLQKPKKLDCSS